MELEGVLGCFQEGSSSTLREEHFWRVSRTPKMFLVAVLKKLHYPPEPPTNSLDSLLRAHPENSVANVEAEKTFRVQKATLILARRVFTPGHCGVARWKALLA